MTLYTDSAPQTRFALTGDPFVDSLYDSQAYFRTKWSTVSGGKTTISYSFPFLDGVASKFTSNYGKEPTATQHFGVTDAQVPGIDLAFQRWADVANLSFTKVPETAAGVVGDIRIAFSSAVSSSFWGYTKIYSDGTDPSQGDVWIEPGIKDGTFQPYTYDFVAMMHEIGHALGLAHPFEGNIIPAGYDDMRYTIMSYTDPKGDFYFKPGSSDAQFIILTPGVYDIAAVQNLYGANMAFHAGNDTYTFTPDQPVYETIWDAGGIDTLDVSAFTKGTSITLVPGTYSQLAYDKTTLDANIGIAFKCIIENANGGHGNDTIVGNDAANQLRGNDGNDTISGGAGNDLIDGGAGADTENGQAGDDTFAAGTDTGNDSFNGGDGLDTVNYAGAKAGVYVDLGAGTASGIDAGDKAAIGTDTLVSIERVIGSASADQLTGSAGADRLEGGAGNDTLLGGDGNDVLVGGAGDDTLNGGNGSDTASYAGSTGAVSVSLALTGPQDTLGAGHDTLAKIENLIGSSFADTLTGNAGNNRLDGGLGDDTLIGGAGNDTYVVDAKDVVVEAAGGGTDTEISSASNTVLAANVENLTLATGGLNATGNELANKIIGNAAANLIDGGAGADIMTGGAGNDSYVIDNVGDRIVELAGGGHDSAVSSVSFTLSAGLEDLTLTGTADLTAIGNADNNVIIGNDGANLLRGGLGDDQLWGKAGADTLRGEAGNDLIVGGAGRDIMTGGAGSDTFVFAGGDFAGTSATTCDLIMDFNHAEGDKIDLSAVDANAATAGVNDAFAFIGTDAFGHIAGQLRVAVVTGGVILQGDTNGDGIADFWVRCDGASTLVAGDLVL